MDNIWSLYREKEYLEPLEYSTGKNQRDLVKEIIEEFKDHDVVLLKGMVGTGKSAVALNVAKEMGRSIFSVPTKPLQDQYIEDYEKNLDIIKDGDSLDIQFIKGRNNFFCPYSEEAEENCYCYTCEGGKTYANCGHLPCSVSIVNGELNGHVILKDSAEYSEEDLVQKNNLSRLKVGELCPYWAPLYNFELNRDGFLPQKYSSVNGFSYWNKRKGNVCPFYGQFRAYIESDVIVYNSKMYEIETLYSERKPKVDLEVIDEADLFLDQLDMKTSIFYSTLKNIKEKINEPLSKKEERSIETIFDVFDDVLGKEEISEFDQKINEFLSALDYLLGNIEQEWADKKQLKIEKILKFSNEVSFIGIKDEEKISFFIPKPSELLNEFIQNSGDKVLLMSATLQSDEVLKNIFGLTECGKVLGEPRIPGELFIKKPSNPVKLTSNRFNKKKIRDKYHKSLEECIERSKKPCLIHIHAYRYLPEEIRERAIDFQDNDIKEFKEGNREVLFSTKLKRGMDLKGEKCRSVIIQKYPYPNLSDPYLRALKERLGSGFWDYYEDMARRDLIQQIGRVVRSTDDWAEIWSPDKKVYYKLRNLRKMLNIA